MDTLNFNTNTQQKSTIRCFKQLTLQDKRIIETLLLESRKKNYNGPKITCSYLAERLGFSRSTLSRELKRGYYSELVQSKGRYETFYRSDRSNARRYETIKRSHYKTKLEKNCFELQYISYQLKLGADVHTAIFYYLKTFNKPFPVCEKTIYNYYHKKMIKGIKPYRKSKERIIYPKMVQKGKNISERPFVPKDRSTFGHWEGDLIVGSRGSKSDCLLTLIERQTRFYYAVKIPSKHMKSVVNALNNLEEKLESDNFKRIFKSITFDNGCEFRDFKGMEQSIDNNSKRTDIYFANPFHSWERGSNERGNRMMRKFFPKGTDFSKVTDNNINKSLNIINYSIRKVLGNESAMDKIEKLENSITTIFEKFEMKNILM